MGMQNLVSIVAIAIAVGSMIFTAIQTRILARQTKMLQITTELSYNLEVLGYMNEAILRIADRRKSRYHVWGKIAKQNSSLVHQGRIFLDVLDAAVSGMDRLSKVDDSEFENWAPYAKYVLEHSRSLRSEISEHPAWWPHLAVIMEKMPYR
jgi:hypothetical protein